jgi:regulator of sigma E protease
MSDLLMSPLIAVLALIVTLGILITVHEFGHFWLRDVWGSRCYAFR